MISSPSVLTRTEPRPGSIAVTRRSSSTTAPASTALVEEGLVRAVGEGDAAVRLEEHLLSGAAAEIGQRAVTSAPGEQLVADAARGERPRVLGRDRPEVEPAGRAR